MISLGVGLGLGWQGGRAPPVPAGAIWGVQADRVVLTGGAVSTWPDVIGSNDLVQGTAGKRPTLTANAFGTRQGVSFDGVSQFMANTALVIVQPYTIYFVAKIVAPGSGVAIFIDNTNTAMECYCSPTYTGFYAGAVLTGGSQPSGNAEAYAYVAANDTLHSTINRNNTVIAGPGNAGLQNGVGVTLGSLRGGTIDFTQCVFGCCYLVGAADSLATQQAFLRQCATYYTVSGVA